MGSSKRDHKSKKDHHKRKHRRRSDSEERSPREKRSKHERHERESKSHKSSKDRHSRSDRDRENRDRKSLNETQNEQTITVEKEVFVLPNDEESETSQNRGGGGDESLSIAETNKLREKLGLKPLSVGGQGGNNGEAEDGEEEFVHAPAEDLWKRKKEEKLREKIQAKKEKRLLDKKLGKIKTLGEEEEESASSWVVRSRNKEVEINREKELSAIGDEFGVGDLVDNELVKTENKSYTERDLKGINVEHSIDSFKEGKNSILVIKDKDILASDDEDVLHSINIQDVEKSKKNMEIKRRGAGYKAYEEEEVDEMGFFKTKSVLGKYDDEIGGEKSNKFTIGAKGMVDTSWEQQKESMKQEIRAKGETLSLPPLKIASEYLTEEEMKFKKRKRKVKKVRKRVGVKADDLLPLPGDVGGQDHGKRRSKPGVIPGWNEGIEVTKTHLSQEDEDEKVIQDDDDAGDELQRALQKSRRAKKKVGGIKQTDEGAVKVAAHIENLTKIKLEKPEEQFSNTIFLNATDEFCRQLGANVISTMQSTDNTSNLQEDDDMEIDPENDEEEDNQAAQWNSVNSGDAEKPEEKAKNQENDDHAPIEAEPLAGAGVMGALQLAKRKGYLNEVAKKGNTIVTTNMNSKLHAQNYAIEDKNAVDYLDKYASEKYTKDRSSRYDRGMIQDFNEKKDYKPTIAIEYVDDRGRGLSAKEAFRNLSHRFHGKGSGKTKQEKRMKKRVEADTMKHMSSTDTPLNTVAMMKEKLKQESSPYIVLSGAGKTLMTGGGEALSKHK